MFGLWGRPNLDFEFTYYHNPCRSELAKIYSSCDIFISSSELEGCPLVHLEAMACKCAVVTTDSLGVREFAENYKTALVVPAKDTQALVESVIKLLEDNSLREQIASQGYQKAQEFHFDRTIDRLEEVFRNALS
jgi:glycosyltransferase involved in cell wall biosynthesis